VALVVGNAAYKTSPLKNPVNDAVPLARALSRLGFELDFVPNAGIVHMRRMLRDFSEKAQGADWALVFYAGHGLQLRGKNWLIPIDAELRRESDLLDEAVPAEDVLDGLHGVRRLRIVIFDACRRNPSYARMFDEDGALSMPLGLAPIQPSHGEVVFYSARHGAVADDGPGLNSPFTEALLDYIEEEGLELGVSFVR
jgi:uncharacterized caspase-like protein